jgi:U32 family peptidase
MSNLKEKAKLMKILAPAGDWESLRAAVEAGADSVYFGIQNFNMRSTGAKNFSITDLKEIVDYCTQKNVETYVTVNTVMYDSDLSKMRDVIEKAKDSGCNGVIVSDFSAINYANKIIIPVCISTQVSVSNIEAVKFFAKYAKRIILARELNLEQIKKITEAIEKEKIRGVDGNLIEIEIFAHGALCVAVSGRCSMSLYCYDSSANKGECTQVCRRKYKVTDFETNQELIIDNNYIMSPKDLCTVGLLPEIVDSGVKVLKLEGRGRPPEYVDMVVRCYKEALKHIAEGSYSQKIVKNLNKKLETVFNRGLNTGMYMGRKVDEWAKGAGNQASFKRVFLGNVLHFFPKKRIALIKILGNVNIKEGEECIIIGKNTGIVKFKLENIHVDEKVVKNVGKNTEFSIKTPKIVRKNDEVYILKTL